MEVAELASGRVLRATSKPPAHAPHAKSQGDVSLHRDTAVGRSLADHSQDSPELLKSTEMTQAWHCYKNEQHTIAMISGPNPPPPVKEEQSSFCLLERMI